MERNTVSLDVYFRALVRINDLNDWDVQIISY